jgi:hypothetical protein
VVALARYLSNLPKGTLNRSYLFTMTTGHMANYPGRSWSGMVQRQPALLKQVVGSLVFEHLGAMEWADRDGAYLPTGDNQTTLVITRNGRLAKLMLDTCAGTIDDRLLAVDPYKHFYTGESGGVIEMGIPCVGIMPAPSYLLKESRSQSIECIDPRYFRVQLENFTRLLMAMDRMPRQQLAEASPWATS